LIDFQDIYSFYSSSGYIGILITSFIGSILVFIPVPYFPILISSALNKDFDPHLIALTSAIGAVLAKMIIFIASYYGRNILSNKTKTRMQPLQNILTKYGGIGAFIAALTPIPDDLVYIPLGLAKYSIKKFTIVTFLGKFILGEIIVWGTVFLGRPIMEEVLSVSDANNQFSIIVVSVLTVVVLILVLFFTFKVDWSKIIGRWFPWALDKNLDEKNNK